MFLSLPFSLALVALPSLLAFWNVLASEMATRFILLSHLIIPTYA
jgi:hypothetical protein